VGGWETWKGDLRKKVGGKRESWKVRVEGWREERREKVEGLKEKWRDEKARVMEDDGSDEGVVWFGRLRESERLWILWWCCDWMITRVEEGREKWTKERAGILEADASDVARVGRLRERLWVLWWCGDLMDVRISSLASSVQELVEELRSKICPEV
jgi:hypothetical protein